MRLIARSIMSESGGVPVAAAGGRVSVVIPTVNRSGLLAEALSSVLASPVIDSPRRIIVVDDDSEDDTAAVAGGFGVTYLRVRCHSISSSRNAGFALTTTPYVTFLDHDDVWLPGNMEPQLAALERHGRAAFAYGVAQCATEDMRPLPTCFPAPPLAQGVDPERLHQSYPNLGVVLFRRDAIATCGGFDPAIQYHQDGDLMIKIAAEREIVGLDFVGMLHRLRAPSRSRSDYYWSMRAVTRWRPRQVGVGWPAATNFVVKTRGLFCHRFLEDSAACVSIGDRWGATVSLARAVRTSPAHSLRSQRTMWSILGGLASSYVAGASRTSTTSSMTDDM